MASTVGEVLARRIRGYRVAQGLTQQQVADRTKELGTPISRDNLAKIETAPGRADSLSVADMLVLAAALDVPPVLLMVPLGEDEEVMVTHGVAMHPYLAYEWIGGQESFTRDRYEASWDRQAWLNHSRVCRVFDKLRRLQTPVTNRLGTEDDRERLLEHLAEMRADGLSVPTIEGVNDGER